MAFSGFSKQASDFLWELMFNNEREWFLAHKNIFEQEVNKPFKALAEAVCARLNERMPNMQWQCHVSRIYRDARRLFGRGPYKEKLWFSVYPAATTKKGPCLWFELGAAGYGYGFGFYDVTPAMMDFFRKGIDSNPARFTRLAESVEALDGFFITGEEYKRKKAERGELINKWYNRKWIGVEREEDFGGALLSGELVDVLVDAYIKCMPMYEYLVEFYFACGDTAGK